MWRAENLSISFGNKRVFEDFSFSCEKKLAIIGGNGAGKTSLALCLAGVIPDFIPARVSGKRDTPEMVSVIMQNPSSQFFSMTVKEELGSIETARFNVGHLLEKNVFELSEGEKQKINLIANLALNPGLLLLDEPLELLDPFEAKRFLELINKIKEIPLVWFDKNDFFVRGFPKKLLGEQKKTRFPERKYRETGPPVLKSDFSVQKNGFSLEGAKFDLRQGEKIALIGRNGSGKTTVLKAIAGLEKAVGRVDVRAKICFVPQNPSHIFFEETVGQELSCLDYASRLGISSLLNQGPNTLSKGQQKLLSLATISPGSLFLLDEPTTWLDDSNRALVCDFISNAAEAMLIATHDAKLLDYCDRIFLIEEGGVRECSFTAANRFFRA